MKNKLLLMLGALAIAFPSLAVAQAGPTSANPATAGYRSAFADYNAYKEVSVGNWRVVNEVVSQAPVAGTSDAASPAASSQKPAPVTSSPAPAIAASSPAKPTSAASAAEHESHHGGQK